jgi:hypothetical protein
VESKRQLLEKITVAIYHYDCAPFDEKAVHMEAVNSLFDQARGESGISRERMWEIVYPLYLEYKRAQKRSERLSSARNIGTKP